jgi:hypothetical protein
MCRLYTVLQLSAIHRICTRRLKIDLLRNLLYTSQPEFVLRALRGSEQKYLTRTVLDS